MIRARFSVHASWQEQIQAEAGGDSQTVDAGSDLETMDSASESQWVGSDVSKFANNSL